ncbi:MAG: DUF1428 domain-containing protein [Oligoflexia bacterium]|nr:DUF1428 domain-containing protein [Oligoflexia bacterium]
MGIYVDGFIVPVPKKKLNAYIKLAKLAGKIWIEHGALEYVECGADDVKKGKITSFPRSIKMKSTETVFFSWATYKSRAHRDQVMAKVMKDPRMKMSDPKDWPFDGMRMIFGGFKSQVSLKRSKR